MWTKALLGLVMEDARLLPEHIAIKGIRMLMILNSKKQESYHC